jgi:phosphotransferase system  glucose/maltose/N-acetylglucosamine-specific IIC component
MVGGPLGLTLFLQQGLTFFFSFYFILPFSFKCKEMLKRKKGEKKKKKKEKKEKGRGPRGGWSIE